MEKFLGLESTLELKVENMYSATPCHMYNIFQTIMHEHNREHLGAQETVGEMQKAVWNMALEKDECPEEPVIQKHCRFDFTTSRLQFAAQWI
jgi:hypothetical protein